MQPPRQHREPRLQHDGLNIHVGTYRPAIECDFSKGIHDPERCAGGHFRHVWERRRTGGCIKALAAGLRMGDDTLRTRNSWVRYSCSELSCFCHHTLTLVSARPRFLPAIGIRGRMQLHGCESVPGLLDNVCAVLWLKFERINS